MIKCSLRSKIYLTSLIGLIVTGRPRTSQLEMFWCSPTEQFICPPQTSQTSIRASFEHNHSFQFTRLRISCDTRWQKKSEPVDERYVLPFPKRSEQENRGLWVSNGKEDIIGKKDMEVMKSLWNI